MMQVGRRVGCLSLLGFLIVSAAARAQLIRVPQDAKTLTDAISRVSDGGVIQVAESAGEGGREGVEVEAGSDGHVLGGCHDGNRTAGSAHVPGSIRSRLSGPIGSRSFAGGFGPHDGASSGLQP